MTTRSDFTDDEWTRLGRAPLLAGIAISLADPGGPIETLKESSAALQTIVEASGQDTYGAFVRELASDVAAKARERQSPMGDFKPGRSTNGDSVLAELRDVNRLLVERLDPEDADGFREWVKTAAQRTALAAKEGGFLGIGAERVSEREQQMLDRLAEAFHSAAA